MNAILNKNSTDVKGCTVRPMTRIIRQQSPVVRFSWWWLWQIYVALFPCNECAKLIIQVR